MSSKRNRDYGNKPDTAVTEEEVEEVTVQEAWSDPQDVPPLEEPVTQEPVIENKEPVEPLQVLVKETVKPKQTQPTGSVMDNVESTLVQYQTKMKTKMTQEETAKVQLGLLTFLREVLRNPDGEVFRKKWNAVLRFFNENKEDVFNEYYLFRGAEAWTGGSSEYTLFRRLGWVLIQTANPVTRKANSVGINIGAVAGDMTEAEANNFINYYS